MLCDLVWVLGTAYHFTKPDILSAVERILRTAQFEISPKDIVWVTVDDYRRGRADLSDYYLGRMNEKCSASVTITFDKALKHNTKFRVLAP